MRNTKVGLAIVYALLAALIGGAVWMIIAILTDYELGFIAWGIGGLAGYAVILAARNKIRVEHQVIAVIASLLGIVLGKYFILGYYFDESISGIFNADVFSVFLENFIDFFGGVDIIFVLLAVVTAWQIPTKFSTKEQVLEVKVGEGNRVDANQ